MRLPLKVLRFTDILFLILAVGVALFYIAVSGGGFPLDDSWIHQVYGRNLALNGRWEFIAGEPSAASTSPLYTVILAVGYRLGLDYRLWTHGVGALALAITGMLGARMAERLFPGSRYIGFVTGAALIIAWHHNWAAVSGMETMIFCLFTLMIMMLAWRELDDNRSIETRSLVLRGGIFGLVSGLTTLTRPEGVMLVALVGIVMLVIRPQGSLIRVIVWGVAAMAAFMAVLAPYLIMNIQITGGLLPDTAAAKRAGIPHLYAVSYFTNVWEMLYPLLGGGQILLVPGVIIFIVGLVRQLRQDKRVVFYLIPAAWSIGLILLYAAYLPAPYHHGRYVIPSLPAWIVIGMVGSFQMLWAGRTSAVGRVFTRTVAVSTAVAFLYFAFIAGPAAYRNDVRIIEEEMVTAAHWITANLPPDQLLVLHDIGAVGYFAPRPLLDVAGLISPEVVPFIGQTDKMWDYIQEQGGRYLLGFVDQIPGGDVNNSYLCPIYTTDGQTTQRIVGGKNKNMIVYALTWDGTCPVIN